MPENLKKMKNTYIFSVGNTRRKYSMIKNIITGAAAVFMLCGAAGAATVDFRSGTVLAAEISSKVPEVKGMKVDFPAPVCARVVFKLHPERKVSIHDYALNAYGRNFKAAAIARNNGVWVVDGSAFDNNSDSDRFSLLFILDGSVIGKRSVEELEITAVPDPKGKSTPVKFRNLKNGSFPSVNSISKNGTLVK